MQAETQQSGLTLRTATAQDAACIHEMLMALAKSTSAPDKLHSTAEDIHKYGFSDPPCFHALIAEQGDKAVGLCLYFYSFSSWMGRRGVYVQDLWVDDKQRGTGLGRRLISETARQASKQGAVFMRLSVDGKNDSAQKFYRSIGMEYAENECIFKAVGARFEALKRLD